jgi:DNA-binding transcriptional MerR regulator
MTSADLLARVPGLTYRQLDHWCSRGYIQPDKAHPGSGRQRQFGADEVRVIRAMHELVANGVLPAAAARLARSDRPVIEVPVAAGVTS